jgi:diaminopimelate epimerase
MASEFFKYTAMGNDMIVIDPARCPISPTPATIRLICDRHFGAGADGICFGPIGGRRSLHTMRFYNPDGSEAEKSGNGLRIFARYLWDNQYVNERVFDIEMNGERIPAQVLDADAERISLGMGRLTFQESNEETMIAGATRDVTVVSIGNPHAIVFDDNLALIHTLGPVIETAPSFPERTNVQIVRVLDRGTIEIEIWERGAGYTISSGTSCSAAAGAAIRRGDCDSPLEVRMPGGTAHVTITDDWQVVLVGQVRPIYQAMFSDAMLQQLAGDPTQVSRDSGE